MAKKNFKGGLGSLIKDTRIDDERTIKEEPETTSNENESEIELKRMINRLEKELKLWRTGKLNFNKFNKSLAENKLTYNDETNSFEIA